MLPIFVLRFVFAPVACYRPVSIFTNPLLIFWLAILPLLSLCDGVRAQETSPVQVQGVHDRFVFSLLEDAQQRVWLGTEDQGVWLLEEADGRPRWTQYTRPDGLGDDSIHALAQDQQGRIWAGHLNHGVSVFNGPGAHGVGGWRNYSIGQGPIGERVFDIKVCPTNGDVWIATNCGLSRYAVRTDTWSHLTQEDGLLENGVYRLAFTAAGDIVVGTESHGLMLASFAANYHDWRGVSGPASLPDDLINDILVTPTGSIYVATTNGMARSEDGGKSWRVLRGRDAADKGTAFLKTTPDLRKAALRKVGQNDEDGKYAAATQALSLSAPLLREDYITCLAQDGEGRLWIGYRRYGYEVRDARSLQVISPVEGQESAAGSRDDFVRAILPRSTGDAPMIGFYGRGIRTADDQLQQAPSPPAPTPQSANLPTPTGAPSSAEMSALLQRLVRVGPPKNAYAPLITALADDWSTQGDWLGRYGRYQAVLGAMLSPNDYVWGAGEVPVAYRMSIGPNASPDDSLRYWVQWLHTRSAESLEMPSIYYHSRLARGWDRDLGNRRQSEWDDHGEVYPMTLDGPHVYASLRVPAGWFVLSLYDFNKDGQIASNRWRDYRISIRPRPSWLSLANNDDFSSWPELAQGRIHDFRGGVWKRFLVRGPQDLTVEVNRNYSFNTVLAGWFLDRLEERPAPYFGTAQQTQARARQSRARSESACYGNWTIPHHQRHAAASVSQRAKLRLETAHRLWEGLQEVQLLNPPWHEDNSRPYYLALLRWCRQTPAASKAQGNWQRDCLLHCLYQLRLYPQWEEMLRQEGQKSPRTIELALQWDGVSDNQGSNYQVVTKYLDDLAKNQSHEAAVGTKLPKP